jgi:hypothetical protein
MYTLPCISPKTSPFYKIFEKKSEVYFGRCLIFMKYPLERQEILHLIFKSGKDLIDKETLPLLRSSYNIPCPPMPCDLHMFRVHENLHLMLYNG